MRPLKKLRIQTQIMIAVTGILVIMLMINYFLYVQTSEIVIRNNNRYAEDTMRKFEIGLSQKVDEISQTMLNLAFDPFVQKFTVQSDRALLFEMGKELDRKIISLKAGRKGFEDIVLVGANGVRYSLNGGIDYVRHLEPEIAGSRNPYVSGLEKFHYGSNLQTYMVFAQNITVSDMDKVTVGSRIGYIAVIVNVKAMFFDNDVSDADTGVGFYLVDRYGRVFPETNPPDISRSIVEYAGRPEGARGGTDEIGGVKGEVQLRKLDQIQASILSFFPKETLLAELNVVRTRSISIVIAALVLMSLPLMMIINNIVHPIQRLVKFINSIKSGNLQELKMDLKLEGNVEMTVVAEKLNAMLGEINHLTRKLVETTTHLLEAEIEKEKAASAYLRSQINPHFLYNTLESIRGAALEVGAAKVSEMTKALGKLFHYSIKGPGYVTLEQELGAVKSYVFLQLMRFDGRFDVDYEFAEDSLQVPVMKMILQPLVENAIFHGLEPKTTKGRLTIRGKTENRTRLVLTVTDDGIGMASDRAAEIRRTLTGRSTPLGGDDAGDEEPIGLGLLNVQNRLRLAYGSDYGLTFDSRAGFGTEVSLTMPLGTDLEGGSSDA